MYNWSVNTKRLKKDKKAYEIWRLEQMINYGLGGEKLDGEKLRKYLLVLKIDNDTRKFLEMIL